jgi:hypothetical protein
MRGESYRYPTDLDSSLELFNPTSSTHESVRRTDVVHEEAVKNPYNLGWWDILRKQSSVTRVGTAISSQEDFMQN